ncbi:hypothetical protein SFC65_24355 [Priestia filamentosa]|uniref:hypothetical protein n=1 Tax=Priestia filamentosa TaxID=1402861 RepID=UPI003981C29F
MRIDFFNDTKRVVTMDPNTFKHGCIGEEKDMDFGEIRTFTLPEGFYPELKIEDEKEKGLILLITAHSQENVVIYHNHTNRNVTIHTATFEHGCTADKNGIAANETCAFTLPNGTFPWVKMWDYGIDDGVDRGLMVLVSPTKQNNE